jgi:aromatic-amino-acid transaminase
VETYPYYDAAQARHQLRRHADGAEHAPSRHRRRAARLLPQPDRLRHHARAVGPGGRRVKARKLVAFLDMAYQGFGQGIAEDGVAVQKFVALRRDFFVSTSFSKSFSLYGERVGALSVLCQDKDEPRACCRS